MSSDVKELLEAASKSDNFVDCDFDRFLKENGFSEESLTERVLMNELFLFFSCYYYIKHKKLPHPKQFAGPSVMLKLYKIRQHSPTKLGKNYYLPWGFKCNEAFKTAVTRFMERSEAWQKKYNAIKNAKKSHKARKVNRKEKKQLETLLTTQHLTKDSSLK